VISPSTGSFALNLSERVKEKGRKEEEKCTQKVPVHYKWRKLIAGPVVHHAEN